MSRTELETFAWSFSTLLIVRLAEDEHPVYHLEGGDIPSIYSPNFQVFDSSCYVGISICIMYI